MEGIIKRHEVIRSQDGRVLAKQGTWSLVKREITGGKGRVGEGGIRLGQHPYHPTLFPQLPAVLGYSIPWTGWWQKCKTEVTKFTGVPTDELQLALSPNLWH